MQTPIVKTKEAYDFLALVPQLVGFLPERSIVLVAFRGNRTCGAMRFNLPDPAAPDRVHKRVATSLIGTLCKIPGVDAVVPVAYTDDRFAAVTGMPHERFADTLIRRAELSGFVVRDALCVGADGWGSYLESGCPAGGHPLSEIATSTVHEELPAGARLELATLQSRADLPQVDPAAKRRVARELERYQRLGRTADSLPELIEMVRDILDPVETAEHALAWDAARLQAADAAALLFLVQGPANRDQMMLQFAFGEQVGIQTFELNVRYAAIQGDHRAKHGRHRRGGVRGRPRRRGAHQRSDPRAHPRTAGRRANRAGHRGAQGSGRAGAAGGPAGTAVHAGVVVLGARSRLRRGDLHRPGALHRPGLQHGRAAQHALPLRPPARLGLRGSVRPPATG